jgi:hypothetical protein
MSKKSVSEIFYPESFTTKTELEDGAMAGKRFGVKDMSEW